MPGFEIVWNRRRLQWRRHAERSPFIAEAVLGEGNETRRLISSPLSRE
jgi:hypothetical protein